MKTMGRNKKFDCNPFVATSNAYFFFMISRIMELTMNLSSFQFCQNNSKVHFLKDFNVKKNDVSKLKILSKWQLSILEDKNVCQSNKYYHDNILNSLCNTLRCIINSNPCCCKYLHIYINKCCTITLTVFQLMTYWTIDFSMFNSSIVCIVISTVLIIAPNGLLKIFL